MYHIWFNILKDSGAITGRQTIVVFKFGYRILLTHWLIGMMKTENPDALAIVLVKARLVHQPFGSWVPGQHDYQVAALLQLSGDTQRQNLGSRGMVREELMYCKQNSHCSYIPSPRHPPTANFILSRTVLGERTQKIKCWNPEYQQEPSL